MINNKNPKAKLGNLLGLKPYLKPYKAEISYVIITLTITSMMVLFMGKAVKYLVDLGFSQQSHFYFNLILIAVLIAILILAIAGYFRSSLINSVGEKVIARLRSQVYSHIIKVSPEFFEITKTGDVISRLTVDTTLLYNIISNAISFAMRNLLMLIGGIIFLFLTSIKLTLITFIAIPIAIIPIIFLGKKIKKLSTKNQEAVAIVGSHIEETINGIKTVQSYICEDKEINSFNRLVDDSLNAALKKIKLRSLLISLMIIFAFGSVVIVLWIGGKEVLNGKMTAGDLSSFIFYSMVSATSLIALSEIAGQLQTASAAAMRLFELLNIKSPIIEISNPEKLDNNNSIKIKFDKVNFSYPARPEKLILKNFNLEINPQQKIALVGPSGAGKSTILQLLMRFYDCNSGQILFGNHDIKNLSLSDLRNLFSYISQDCFIFSGTIFENIAYVNKNISFHDVEKVIAENEALHFINNYPQKLHSFVGEKGIRLSGGERQRIAIARAIIKNSPILLLDEATSALDNKNEELINKSINDLMKQRTVISIAHRLSTIVNSDLIIFIKDGGIVQSGIHQQLIKVDGFYKNMYESTSL